MNTIYKITLDPDWGMRWARDRKYSVYIDEPKVIPSNLERILKKYSQDAVAAKMLVDGAAFNSYKFGYNIDIERVNVLSTAIRE